MVSGWECRNGGFGSAVVNAMRRNAIAVIAVVAIIVGAIVVLCLAGKTVGIKVDRFETALINATGVDIKVETPGSSGQDASPLPWRPPTEGLPSGPAPLQGQVRRADADTCAPLSSRAGTHTWVWACGCVCVRLPSRVPVCVCVSVAAYVVCTCGALQIGPALAQRT